VTAAAALKTHSEISGGSARILKIFRPKKWKNEWKAVCRNRNPHKSENEGTAFFEHFNLTQKEKQESEKWQKQNKAMPQNTERFAGWN
jgi:hypothetical protein